MALEQRPTACLLAASLRSQGKSVEMALHPEQAKTFFSRIGKGQIGRAVYIGPDDLLSGTVRINDLATRQEEEIPLPSQ